MLPARTLDRIGKQNRWLREVCDVEEMALLWSFRSTSPRCSRR